MIKNNLIRKIRRELDLSQEYIAQELNISQKAFSDIENGKTKLTSSMLLRISTILNVKPSEICPLSSNCSCLNLKNERIEEFLKNNNIDFPSDLFK